MPLLTLDNSHQELKEHKPDPSVEDKVKFKISEELRELGYQVKAEVPVVDSGRNVILDFFAFSHTGQSRARKSSNMNIQEPTYSQAQGEPSPPDKIWVECKGDVNLSELIEGFARLDFALFYSGGRGIFAAPQEQIKLMKDFETYFSAFPNIELRVISLD
ncbi:MAG: hypothetical protein KGN01_07510 [Patescibacteria group bacterium]|nr:hypothetical protein [Patescibacteria group bacterium]